MGSAPASSSFMAVVAWPKRAERWRRVMPCPSVTSGLTFLEANKSCNKESFPERAAVRAKSTHSLVSIGKAFCDCCLFVSSETGSSPWDDSRARFVRSFSTCTAAFGAYIRPLRLAEFIQRLLLSVVCVSGSSSGCSFQVNGMGSGARVSHLSSRKVFVRASRSYRALASPTNEPRASSSLVVSSSSSKRDPFPSPKVRISVPCRSVVASLVLRDDLANHSFVPVDDDSLSTLLPSSASFPNGAPKKVNTVRWCHAFDTSPRVSKSPWKFLARSSSTRGSNLWKGRLGGAGGKYTSGNAA
mmetsp:Transcript_2194/g.14575  ORF Transcript_2194/g.14575 Transcript_2194/m.14575 type:complete len:300 (+) Transcript_2194:812-1711(+)